MPFEGPPQENAVTENEETAVEKTPSRLLWLNKIFVESHIPRVHVHGMENLEQIPPGKKVIIITTHISDFDMPIVLKELGERFNIVVADMSLHHNLLDDPQAFLGNSLAGMSNFIPIDYTNDRRGIFHPENFTAMETAMKERGKTAMIAGHNPVKKGMALPDNGGYGGVYLASITENAIILPVAVSLRSTKPVGFASDYSQTRKEQPEADLIVGKPIELAKIEEAGRLSELIKKPKSGQGLTPEERSQFENITTNLRKESDILMSELAKMLPSERRGKWNSEKEK